MNIQFRSSPKFDQPATIVLLSQEQIQANKFANHYPSELKKRLLALIDGAKFSGELRQTLPFFYDKKMVIFVGAGDEKNLSSKRARVVVRHAFLSPFLKDLTAVEIIPPGLTEDMVAATIDGVLIGGYRWKKYKTDKRQTSVKTVYIVGIKTRFLEEQVMIDEGVNLARDMINDNADIVTGEYFDKMIRNLTRGQKNISLEVLGQRELQKKGLNLLLAVNQGSTKMPRLIIVKYHGDPSSKNYTAIIGKGITFDTGGLNLKPTGSLETMRSDMSGAAAVVGTLRNTLALKLKANVIFAVAMAENAIGSRSYKPGDVFRGYNGKTVEIMNTDAEGRLILADAVAYVAKNYKPCRIIDIATLTGACVIALGYDHAGLIATDDTLANRLLAAAQSTDDQIWRLPTYPDLQDAIKSEIADIKNTGFPKGAAGTLTGAEFIRQFTEDIPWAHLDIAGTSFMEGQGRSYYSYGGTGSGVRLLTRFLQNS